LTLAKIVTCTDDASKNLSLRHKVLTGLLLVLVNFIPNLLVIPSNVIFHAVALYNLNTEIDLDANVDLYGNIFMIFHENLMFIYVTAPIINS
jgi:hypothetical protein